MTINTIRPLLQVHSSDSIAIIASTFNHAIVDQLVSGCVDNLIKHGAKPEQLQLIYTPGAYEIPWTVQRVLTGSKKISGVIALGAVIEGATKHFDFIGGYCTNQLGDLSIKHNLPITFGVLTVHTIEQAWERAGTKAGNKGIEASNALIELLSLQQQL